MADDAGGLIDLEMGRIAAIGVSEFDAVAGMLSEEYVHVLASGETHDRASYMELIRGRRHSPQRGKLSVRRFGDGAVIQGEIFNDGGIMNSEEGQISFYCTQVAVRRDGCWKFVSYIETQTKHPT